MAAPAYVAHKTAWANGPELTIEKPAGTLNNHVLVAFIYSDQGKHPVLPPEDWEIIYNPTAGGFSPGIFWRRASGEPDDYTFTAATSTRMAGLIITISGCTTTGSPLGGYAGVAGHFALNAQLLAEGATVIENNVLLLFMGVDWSDYSGIQSATAPEGYTERIDATYDGTFLYAATDTQDTAGPTGAQYATLSKITSSKYAVLVPLTGPRSKPTVPVISSPAHESGAAPGKTVNLTASASDPGERSIKYRWKYNRGEGGGDVLIGETSLVASGSSATLSWNVSRAGTYTLKCWAVNDLGQESSEFSSLVFYARDAIIVSPAHGSSHMAGLIMVKGKGYALTAGNIILDWERDTHCPPDPISDNYESWQSDDLAQGAEAGDYRHFIAATWCIRARTVKAAGITRTNMCAYPSLELDTNSDGLANGWSSYVPDGNPHWSMVPGRQQGLAQRFTDVGGPGDGSDRFPLMYQSASGAVANGGSVVVSLYAKGKYSGCTLYLMFQIRDASGVTPLIYATPLELDDIAEDEWTRYQVTYLDINNASASSVLAYIWLSDWGSGSTVDVTIDDVLIERGGDLRPYFDGGYYGASWAGTAHASRSSTTYNVSDWTAVIVYLLEELKLLAGSQVKLSILQAANKVFVKVRGTEIMEDATYNITGDPLAYSSSPRETLVLLPDGDATGAQAVAEATLARRHRDQISYSQLKLSLADGLKLRRGELVGVQIDRLGISGTYPIRELAFDVAAAQCQITVGDWTAPKSDQDALVALAQKVDRIERKGA